MTLEGFIDTIGPLGETAADKLTLPEKPLTLVTEIVDVFDDPRTILSDDGLEEIVNPRTAHIPCMEKG